MDEKQEVPTTLKGIVGELSFADYAGEVAGLAVTYIKIDGSIVNRIASTGASMIAIAGAVSVLGTFLNNKINGNG